MFNFDDEEPQDKLLHRELLFAINSGDIDKIENAISLGADPLFKSKVFIYTQERIPLAHFLYESSSFKTKNFEEIFSILVKALPEELPVKFQNEILDAIVAFNSKDLLKNFLTAHPLKEREQLSHLFKKSIFSLSNFRQLPKHDGQKKIEFIRFLLEKDSEYPKEKNFNVMDVWAKDYAIDIIAGSNYVAQDVNLLGNELKEVLKDYVAKNPEVLSLKENAITFEQKERLFLKIVRCANTVPFFHEVIKADLEESNLIKILKNQENKLDELQSKKTGSTTNFEIKSLEETLKFLNELRLSINLEKDLNCVKTPQPRF